MRLSQQLAAARRTRYVKEHLAAELAGNVPPPLEELGLPSVLLVDRDADHAASLADALETRAGVFTASEAHGGAAARHRPAARHGRRSATSTAT